MSSNKAVLTDEQIENIYRTKFEGAPNAARPAPKKLPPLIFEFGHACAAAAVLASADNPSTAGAEFTPIPGSDEAKELERIFLWHFAMGKAADACERYVKSGVDVGSISGLVRSLAYLEVAAPAAQEKTGE